MNQGLNQGRVVIGWDVGGAHLKAVVADSDRNVLATYCESTPVWSGLEIVESAMTAILNRWPTTEEHRITMTAELADVFDSRDEGVRRIIELAMSVFSGRQDQQVLFLTTEGQLVDPNNAATQLRMIASANWVASATWVAQHFNRGVMVDIGSTTTDVIPFENKSIVMHGSTDLDRLRTSSLIYSGVVRTPLCALLNEVEFDGHVQSLAAELFANTADLYRVLRRLPEGVDAGDTCDGRAKTRPASLARIARQFLTEPGDHPDNAWVEVCRRISSHQSNKIANAIERQIGELSARDQLVLVGAGIGRFLLPSMAAQFDIPYREASPAVTNLSESAHHALPATALALWQYTIIRNCLKSETKDG